MLMTAVGLTETHVAQVFGQDDSLCGHDALTCSSAALDLRTGYNFNREADRLRARECQKDEKLPLFVGFHVAQPFRTDRFREVEGVGT